MTGPADQIVDLSLIGFRAYCADFIRITRLASQRFSARDWVALNDDAAERLALYNSAVAEVVGEIRQGLGADASERSAWVAAKIGFAAALDGDPFAPIGRTFFSSITRRVLGTEGTDPAVEFTDDFDPVTLDEPALLSADTGSTEEKLTEVTGKSVTGAPWQNLARDARVAAIEIERQFSSHGETSPVVSVDVYPEPFYRGRAAYVVGTISAGETTLPLALAIHHTTRGLTIGAILTEQDDISVLFSYTRSSFLVDVEHPTALVNFLHRLIPHRKPGELYTAIGFNKHGKTERYRDLRRFIDGSGVRFEYARGIRGMVMIVFTLEGYDAVFKVIRDHFPYPKQTTRRQVMSKYRIVFGHDRAGRLIDAHEFEHMTFDRDRFEPALLEELDRVGVEVGDRLGEHRCPSPRLR